MPVKYREAFECFASGAMVTYQAQRTSLAGTSAASLLLAASSANGSPLGRSRVVWEHRLSSGIYEQQIKVRRET
jgi:hypothetical protein